MRFGRLLILAFLVEAGLSDPHAVGRIGKDGKKHPALKHDLANSEAVNQVERKGKETKRRQHHSERSLADHIGRALDKEFKREVLFIEFCLHVWDEGESGAAHRRSFNETVGKDEGTTETVARVHSHQEEAHRHSHEGSPSQSGTRSPKARRGDGQSRGEGGRRSGFTLVGVLEHITQLSRVVWADETEDVERLIDHMDNEFILSNPREGNLMLHQDLQLISDLVVLLVLATAAGLLAALVGQPVMTGYLLAGALAGPGCLNLVQELVQVETLGQFGVIFLLFDLGLEFNASKLYRVQAPAVLGGLLEVGLLVLLAASGAKFAGATAGEGVFIGAFLSMSSTAACVKCLSESHHMGPGTLAGQITMGTLVVQDCLVGLFFAILPLLGHSPSQQGSGCAAAVRLAASLTGFAICAWGASRAMVPKLLRHAQSRGVELFQMALVAGCLVSAFMSELLGLSLELGAFVAGVCVASTEYAERAASALEPLRTVFAALFLASIGLVMNPPFLLHHWWVLLTGMLFVVVAKATLVGLVVRSMGCTDRMAVAVGISLAQVGEMSFLLLSRASSMGLVNRHLYLLLLGTISLSLIATPLMFRLIGPALSLGASVRLLNIEEDEKQLRQLSSLPLNGKPS